MGQPIFEPVLRGLLPRLGLPTLPSGVDLRIQERARRLERIVQHLGVTQEYPLLKRLPVDQTPLHSLKCAVNYYLWATLSTCFPNKQFGMADDMLLAYPDDLKQLPNVTPNGLVLPKRETFLAYNEMQKRAAAVFRSLGVDSHVDRIHMPINIRMVNGLPNPVADARPRSSTKPHSDIWASEPAEAIQVFMLLLGHGDKSNVRFIQPHEFPASMVRTIDDFNEGACLLDHAWEYETHLDKGYIYLTDPFLIHQTMKMGEGLRLSIDFRFLPKEKLASDHFPGAKRTENYIPIEEWYEYGFERLVTTQEKLTEFLGVDAVKDGYAAPYVLSRIG